MHSPEQTPKFSAGQKTSVNVNNPAITAQAGMQLGDIYFILFRHKWKIVICSLLGLIAGACFYKLLPPPYESQAKLFIRYVMDSRATGPSRDDTRVKALDSQGDAIISSEIEIITSLDLAGEVVDQVGAAKINGPGKGADDRAGAIKAISHNLTAVAAPDSSVIHVAFRHPNYSVVQPVLRAVIASYLKKHVEIHRALGITGDFLTQETDRLRERLAETQAELNKVQNKIGVSSIEEAKRDFGVQMLKLRDQIAASEREYSERSIILHELTGKVVTTPDPTTPPPTPIDPDLLTAYRQTQDRANALHRHVQDLLLQFTSDSTPVREAQAQLEDVEKSLAQMQAQTPALKSLAVTLPAATTSAQPSSTFDPASELAHLKALEATIASLGQQLEATRQDAERVTQLESTVQELRRKKDLEETNYKYYSASLEQARIDEALGAGHVSNISEIQSPSEPSRDVSKARKVAAGIAFAGGALGIGWAFLIELYLDRTIKRPVDIERLGKLPLFISIPRQTSQVPQLLAPATADSQRLLNAPKHDDPVGQSSALQRLPSNGMPATYGEIDPLYPFHETLRDRLIAYFESVNMIHKPKLLAVTGLSRQSGVTTVAAGLAQCLSETGEGNVLLVDMTVGQGSSQQFFNGKPVVGLDELLDTRANAHVQENLYVVSEGTSNSEKLSRNLPQRFSKLVPKLKASDFDYIIFDMPSVSQISVTPRLASLMDMVLLVIESEKTERELVERATALLGQSKAHLGVVLNKTRQYVPKQLHQDSLNDI